jgi:hypothetical protein
MAQSDQWPPHIQHKALEPKHNEKRWIGSFIIYMSLLYLALVVFLIYLLVPPFREAVYRFDRYRAYEPPPACIWNFHYLLLLYYAPSFHFTAGCLVAVSTVGSAIAFCKFARAVNGHGRLVPAVACFLASALPGSLAYCLAYLVYQ